VSRFDSTFGFLSCSLSSHQLASLIFLFHRYSHVILGTLIAITSTSISHPGQPSSCASSRYPYQQAQSAFTCQVAEAVLPSWFSSSSSCSLQMYLGSWLASPWGAGADIHGISPSITRSRQLREAETATPTLHHQNPRIVTGQLKTLGMVPYTSQTGMTTHEHRVIVSLCTSFCFPLTCTTKASLVRSGEGRSSNLNVTLRACQGCTFMARRGCSLELEARYIEIKCHYSRDPKISFFLTRLT
jgi:hypothetical protein